MRYFVISLLAASLSVMSASGAIAACYADYKAKQESPLRLHYGVIEVASQPCQMSRAVTNAVAKRVAAGGWELLQVQSVFDETGLEAKKRDAGEFFLRF